MKDKFTYEVKDFVPTKRRSTKQVVTRLIVSLLIILSIGGIGFGLYTTFKDKESKESEKPKKPSVIEIVEKNENGEEVIEEDTREFVLYALKDYYSHMLGDESRLCKDDFKKFLTTSRYTADYKLKISEMKDMGLGVEEFLRGISVSGSLDADAKNKKYLGNLSARWTIIGINLLQYAVSDDSLRLSSEEFFKESILIDKSVVDVVNTKAGSLFDEWAGMFGFSEDADYKAFKDELTKAGLSDKTFVEIYNEYNFEIKCRRGDGDNKYDVKFVSEKLEEPFIITITTDDDIRLTGIETKLDIEGLMGAQLSAVLDGGEHPSDKQKFNLTLDLGSFTVSGSLSAKFTATNFSVGISGTDGADEIYIKLNGELNTLEKKITATEFSFSLNKENIVSLSGEVSFTPAEEDAKEVVIPEKDNIINIMNFGSKDVESIMSQIQSKIDYYTNLFDL